MEESFIEARNHEQEAMKEDEPTKIVRDTLNILITISGIILTITWGVLGGRATTDILHYARIGTIILFISIVLAVLSLQLIISETLRRTRMSNDDRRTAKSVADEASVRIGFLLVWILFLIGVGFMGGIVFAITPVNP